MEGTLNRKEFEVLVAAVKGECEGVIPQSLIDKGFINGREITQTGKEALEPYKAKRAVFIAAGYGERLRPVTINTPKPLVRVHGKRIIDGLIDACIAAEIPEIIIVRGYLGEQFDQLKLIIRIIVSATIFHQHMLCVIFYRMHMFLKQTCWSVIRRLSVHIISPQISLQ